MCRFVFITLLISCASRILHGNFACATYNRFPYVISLQLNTVQQETRGHRCGGALVTYQHVLTAASCLYDIGPNNVPVLINPGQYRVFAGDSFLTNDASTDRVRTISNFTIHPSYTGPPSHVNDIAIVTLTSPFSKTTVQPLRIPPTNHDPQDFEQCTMVGWGGAISSNTANVELRYATKYVYNQQLCSFLLNSIRGSATVVPNMLCAASNDNLTSGCTVDTGDGGNALVCNGTLTGILLYQQGGCVPTAYPELYTRVNNYTTWMNSIIVNGGSTNNFPTLFAVLFLTLSLTFISFYVRLYYLLRQEEEEYGIVNYDNVNESQPEVYGIRPANDDDNENDAQS